MTIAFLRAINEYFIDSVMEADRKDIEGAIGTSGYPTHLDIDRMSNYIADTVQSARTTQLIEKRKAFEFYKQTQEHRSTNIIGEPKSVRDMLSDIVTAISNPDSVPEGLLVAFREQSDGGDDGDIRNIWQDLVKLGLIQPGDSGTKKS